MRLSTNTLLTVLAGAAMTSAQPGAAWSSTTSSAATSTASAASSSALGSGTPLNGKLTEFLAYSKNMTIQANGVIIDGDEGFSFAFPIVGGRVSSPGLGDLNGDLKGGTFKANFGANDSYVADIVSYGVADTGHAFIFNEHVTGPHGSNGVYFGSGTYVLSANNSALDPITFSCVVGAPNGALVNDAAIRGFASAGASLMGPVFADCYKLGVM